MSAEATAAGARAQFRVVAYSPARSITDAAPLAPQTPAPEIRVQGEATLYRLYDLGYEIHLDRAFDLLGASAPERPRPVRTEAQAIQIRNPPVLVSLGTEPIEIEGRKCDAELSALIFDFGVISLRARVAAPPGLTWAEYSAFGVAITAAGGWREIFARIRARVVERIAPAIERLGEAPVTEDYVVFRVSGLASAGGVRLTADAIRDEDVARLLIGESRPVSTAARRELLSPRFSYFEDDLAVLTWNAALVVEPLSEDTDVQYVLEFANAQLLELRYYDAVLDREIPKIYDRIEEARHGFHILGRRYSGLLAALQTRVADSTELVERVENSLKVTDDVFLARIYASAIEIFRGRTWRSGIAQKLAIVRDAYSMLNAESQARRTETLELIIVLLIVLEIVLALIRR
jgi:hypothetical protein